jgi:hypothetical protein
VPLAIALILPSLLLVGGGAAAAPAALPVHEHRTVADLGRAGGAAPHPGFAGVGPWVETTDYGAQSGSSGAGGIVVQGNGCVVNGTYFYCVGGQNFSNGIDMSRVFYTSLSAGGTFGPWNETTDYAATSGSSGAGGLGIEFPSCVEYAGYIYCIGGALSQSPWIVSDVYFARLTAAGVGPWTETTDYGAASGTTGAGGSPEFDLACAESHGTVYCVGGSSRVYFANLSSTGVGPWTETTDYGATSGTTGAGGYTVSNTACVTNASYLYCVGGQVAKVGNASSASSRVFYAPISAAGVGAWRETTDYGAASGSAGSGGSRVYGTGCLNSAGEIVCVDGNNASNQATTSVDFANLSAAGVGPWTVGGPYGAVPRGAADPHPGQLGVYYEECDTFYDYAREWAGCAGGGTNRVYVASTSGVTQAVTHLTTQLSAASVQVGGAFHDTATLMGATTNAGGTVDFKLFKGGSCLPKPLSDSVVTVTNGVVPPSPTYTALSNSISPFMAVLATYSGDLNNEGAQSTCELINVTLAHPTLTTTISPRTVKNGQTFSDAAQLYGATSNAGGEVTYTLYSDGACGNRTTSSDNEFVVNGQVPSSTPFTAGLTTGGYLSIQAVYGGDSNNDPATAPCERIFIGAGTSPDLTLLCTPEDGPPGATLQCVFHLRGFAGSVAGQVVYLTSTSKNGTFSTTECTLDAAGNGTFSYTDTAPGFPFLVATYPGDWNNNAAVDDLDVGFTSVNILNYLGVTTLWANGQAAANFTSPTGLSVTISGSSAANGTPVGIFSATLGALLPGTPVLPLTNGLGPRYLGILGVTDGTANVCFASPQVEARTTLDYVSAGAWVGAANAQATPGVRVCGNIPVAAVDGTTLEAGDTAASGTASAPVVPTGTILIAVVVLVVIVAVVAVWWSRRRRSSAPPHPMAPPPTP